MNQLMFISLRWLDVLDIMLVAFLIYQLYNIVKGTIAIRIFLGIFSLYLFWKIVGALKMELLADILGQFIGVGVIALIIVFQQEIRRFLLYLGNTQLFEENSILRRLFGWKKGNGDSDKIEFTEIAEACKRLSKEKVGALIVLQKNSSLDSFLSGGQEINAKLSQLLLESIFSKSSPLHDGAVLINENGLASAGNVLPISQSQQIPKNYGMRHRAALGLTENSDAVVVIVSEETGKITIVQREEFTEGIKPELIPGILAEKVNN